jgi:polysaccharide pyruvyl transferase WcaK-like protein
MKGLLLNVGIKNKGNEALVDSTKKIIRSYINDLEFIQMGPEGNVNNEIIPQPSSYLAKSIYPWIYFPECILIRLLRRCGLKIKIPKRSRLYYFDDADIIINTGGDVLSGEKVFVGGFINIIYAILLDKPAILFAESLGFYKNPINRIISKYVFQRVQLILVREELSKQYLLNIGIDPDKIHLTADPAFILSPVSQSRIDDILHLENISHLSKPIVGINPSGLISKYLDSQIKTEEDIISCFAKAIEYLVNIKKANILLIPHVYTKKGDDREIIHKIMKLVPDLKNVYQITGEYSAAELKGIIGLCDIFIGARMHATIASTSLCIPTVGIAYSHKMHGIIGERLGLETYIIDINKLDEKSLLNSIEAVLSNQHKIERHLEGIIPKVQKEAYLNGYYLAKFMKSIFLI